MALHGPQHEVEVGPQDLRHMLQGVDVLDQGLRGQASVGARLLGGQREGLPILQGRRPHHLSISSKLLRCILQRHPAPPHGLQHHLPVGPQGLRGKLQGLPPALPDGLQDQRPVVARIRGRLRELPPVSPHLRLPHRGVDGVAGLSDDVDFGGELLRVTLQGVPAELHGRRHDLRVRPHGLVGVAQGEAVLGHGLQDHSPVRPQRRCGVPQGLTADPDRLDHKAPIRL
mmetsp:Transcript_56694/g.184514  ORF Transcript_56694/g.184514 Transcript_56694/m.184514 type:complete len:228 (+) Transcript_56694:347-1030(+)